MAIDQLCIRHSSILPDDDREANHSLDASLHRERRVNRIDLSDQIPFLYPRSDADAIGPLLHPTIRGNARRESGRTVYSIRGERIARQAVLPAELRVCKVKCDIIA